jgi:hypothetical protein
MTGFDDTLRAASLAILKRELTESERLEFLDLAGAIGMSNVKDYLYMLMIFKRNEDKINRQLLSFRKEIKAKFEEIGALEKKIDATLENSIREILHDGARAIALGMTYYITNSAKKVLGANTEFHFLRGQVLIVCLMSVLAALAYWLGTRDVLGALTDGGRINYLRAVLQIPAIGVAILCGSVYVTAWALDYWTPVKRYVSYKVMLTLKILILLALLWHVL